MLDQYLLTVITYGDVRVKNELDKTRSWSAPDYTQLLRIKTNRRRHDRDYEWIVGHRIALPTPPSQVTVQHFSTKVHHRIVFKELGETIRNVRSMHRVFMCLVQVVFGEYPLRSLVTLIDAAIF